MAILASGLLIICSKGWGTWDLASLFVGLVLPGFRVYLATFWEEGPEPTSHQGPRDVRVTPCELNTPLIKGCFLGVVGGTNPLQWSTHRTLADL